MSEDLVTKPFQVLVVFGDSQLRRTLKATLRQLGYERVHAVENGVEALQWLESGERVDVVVTSLHMTRMDGFELLERIRSQPATRNLPVILMAGKATEQLVAQAIETDADGYLLMPFTPADLDRRIDELMELRTKPSLYHQLLLSGQATLETAPRESLMWFREAVQENPSNPLGHYWLGQALEKAGSPDEAEQAYQQAVALNPLHVKSMERLRELYRTSGRTDELYEILKRLFSARPNRRDIALELGPSPWKGAMWTRARHVSSFWSAVRDTTQKPWRPFSPVSPDSPRFKKMCPGWPPVFSPKRWKRIPRRPTFSPGF